jgi:hypothetical protein
MSEDFTYLITELSTRSIEPTENIGLLWRLTGPGYGLPESAEVDRSGIWQSEGIQAHRPCRWVTE